MPDLAKLLRRLADEYEAEASGEASAQAEQEREQRIARLERQLADAGRGDLDDAAVERWLARTGAELEAEADQLDDSDGDDDQDDGDDGEDENGEQEETRPRQRVTRRNVPKLWSGDDEPDHVEYLDEQGAVKVRPGRKSGVPYGFDVDDLTDDDDEHEAA